MRQRNELMRRARLALRSPSGSGRVLSRQELAEAVNADLYATTGRVSRLDAKYIGSLERGTIRWPNALYRAAFRTALGANTDAELGFYIIRGSVSDKEHADCLSGRALGASQTQPDKVNDPPPLRVAVTESPGVQITLNAGESVTVVCAQSGVAYVAVVSGSVRVVVEPTQLDATSGGDRLVASPDVAGVYALTSKHDGRTGFARMST